LNIPIFNQLHKEGLISGQSLERIKNAETARLFSIHWELRTLLYIGVLLLTGGLGILIYENTESIGHQVILALIALICAGCFIYCEMKKPPFSFGRVQSPNSYFDYILLLGCLTLLTFLAYLQVQYNTFGDAYGLATFIPMIILFFCAYYFDHLGVLSMAIANLAAWMGIAVTPLKIFKANDFADTQIIFAGLILGVFLAVMAHLSAKKKIKSHFYFTYLNFGMNILFVSCLAGMFHFDSFYLAWLVPLGALAYYFYLRSVSMSSFYFMLMLTLYAYVGISYVATRLLLFDNFDTYALLLMYFISSGVYVILFLIRMNKNLKNK
jgi:predicted membrane protein DUF2157